MAHSKKSKGRQSFVVLGCARAVDRRLGRGTEGGEGMLMTMEEASATEWELVMWVEAFGEDTACKVVEEGSSRAKKASRGVWKAQG